MPLKENLLELARTDIQIESLKRKSAELRRSLDKEMKESGLPSFKTDEGPGCFIQIRAKAKCSDSKREELFAWLRRTGHGSFFEPKITKTQLTTVVNEMLDAGQEIPAFIEVGTVEILMVRRNGYAE